MELPHTQAWGCPHRPREQRCLGQPGVDGESAGPRATCRGGIQGPHREPPCPSAVNRQAWRRLASAAWWDSGCARADPAHYRHHPVRMSIATWGIHILDSISTCIQPGWAGQVLWAVTPRHPLPAPGRNDPAFHLPSQNPDVSAFNPDVLAWSVRTRVGGRMLLSTSVTRGTLKSAASA